MKRAWIAGLFLLLACGGEETRPAGLLDREKFKHVLMGSQLIEARVNHEMVKDKRVDSPVQQYYDSLFVAEGVTEAEFKSTFTFYTQHPEELKAIYEEILVDLGRKKDGRR